MNKWRATEDDYSIWVVDERGASVADVRCPSQFADDRDGLNGDDRVAAAMTEHRRRAALISAAPDMYAILKPLGDLDDGSRPYLDGEWLERLRAVLAKAEGRDK